MKNPQQQSVQSKWGHTVTSGDTGFVVVPDMLIKNQKALKLDNTDLAVLLNILAHWWKQDELPHPRLSAIAQNMGCSPRTVERSVDRMQKNGLIIRKPSEAKRMADGSITVRYFDLTGLIKSVEQFALLHINNRVTAT